VASGMATSTACTARGEPCLVVHVNLEAAPPTPWGSPTTARRRLRMLAVIADMISFTCDAGSPCLRHNANLVADGASVSSLLGGADGYDFGVEPPMPGR